MNKEELIQKLKPYMYCYVGSGMLSNDYDEKTALSFANICADIADEYAAQEKKKEAIAFADFIFKTPVVVTKYNGKFKWQIMSESDAWTETVYYSTEQLYELFNQQK